MFEKQREAFITRKPEIGDSLHSLYRRAAVGGQGSGIRDSTMPHAYPAQAKQRSPTLHPPVLKMVSPLGPWLPLKLPRHRTRHPSPFLFTTNAVTRYRGPRPLPIVKYAFSALTPTS